MCFQKEKDEDEEELDEEELEEEEVEEVSVESQHLIYQLIYCLRSSWLLL